MANNYKFSGKRVTLAPSSPVAAGVLCRVKGFVGVALDNLRAAGESVAFALEGVWGLTYSGAAADVGGIGTILYWDTTASALSIGAAADDYAIGKVVTAPDSSTKAFQMLLLPQGRPTGQDQS
jgi:predicted RecA/RadA family phage recombinase